MLTKLIALARLYWVDPELAVLAWKLKRAHHTYLGFPHLWSLVESFLRMRSRGADPLQVAEFGVGRGGSATLLAWLVGRYGGTLTLFDVFGRIPPPTIRDGERAQDRYRTILTRETSDYYGNLPNLLDLIMADLEAVCPKDRVEIVRGRYEDTLPAQARRRSLGLVHIDCDWYESVRSVLAYLQNNLRPDAIIQIDDYSNWQGARRATDEATWLQPFQARLVDGVLVIDTSARKTRPEYRSNDLARPLR